MPVTVRVDRPVLPIIWLDTSVLFKMSRVIRGTNEPDAGRVIPIREKILALVSANKLLCPEANQDAENFGSPAQFSRAFIHISRGVRTCRPSEVKLRQEICAMRAYLSKSDNVDITVDTLFDGDPITQLNAANSSPFLIDIEVQKNEDLIAKLRHARLEIYQLLEELRVRNRSLNVSFSEQLEREIKGDVSERLRQVLDIFCKFNAGQDFNLDQWSGCQPLLSLAKAWELSAGADAGPKAFGEFLNSDHCREVPSNLISSHLMAKLMTGSRKIKHGDAMDISHISTFLPYADLMIVDAAMKHLVEELNLASRYGVACFSLSDSAKIIDWLDGLPASP